MKKIIKWSNFNEVKKNLQDKTAVLVGGCFDIIHYGHLTFLKKAKQEGDFLIVALESDEFIVKKKGKQPIHTQMQRADILSSLEIVDLIILLPLFTSDQDYSHLVGNVKPKIIAVTENDSKMISKRKQAMQTGAKLIIVTAKIPNFSSSKIIKKCDCF